MWNFESLLGLWHLFYSLTGDVKYAEIKTDGGKSRGWGVVRFATPEDAQRAVSIL